MLLADTRAAMRLSGSRQPRESLRNGHNKSKGDGYRKPFKAIAHAVLAKLGHGPSMAAVVLLRREKGALLVGRCGSHIVRRIGFLEGSRRISLARVTVIFHKVRCIRIVHP